MTIMTGVMFPTICRATYVRYFFNPASESCEEFIYGGCEGNKNNFLTMSECNANCKGDNYCLNFCSNSFLHYNNLMQKMWCTVKESHTLKILIVIKNQELLNRFVTNFI